MKHSIFAVLLLATAAFAQNTSPTWDTGFGIGILNTSQLSQVAASASNATTSITQSRLALSADANWMRFGEFGVGARIAWSVATNDHDNGGFPFFYSLNGVWEPLGAIRGAVPVLTAGIGSQIQGVQLTKFSCPNGPLTCAPQSTSDHLYGHLAGHFGLGLKAYTARRFFLRPQINVDPVSHGRTALSLELVFGYTLGSGFVTR